MDLIKKLLNPSRLYGDMTIEKLKTDSYQAQTRNRLIAEAFYLTNDIEKYGSGYIRVRKEISSYPTMKFEYEEMGNGYLVTLSYEEQKTSLKTPLNTPLKSTREKIVALMESNPKITISSISKELNVGRDTINEHIARLKKENRIERVGGTRGYWTVLNAKK